jgi:importin-7
MSEQVQMPVRQAGAIYLKNMVSQYWMDRKAEKPNELVPFCLYDSDKQTIRDNLIEAVIHSPDPIRFIYKYVIEVFSKKTQIN